MDKDRILQTLKKELRSLLIASKLGLSVQELEHDYRSIIGSPLPFRTLNYRSTMELLLDMPDVVKVCTQVDGSVVLSAVVNEQTKAIAELVSRQKTSNKRKVIYKRRLGRPLTHMDLVRRGRTAPVLPAFVKSELRDLLSISPLLVSQLESSYYKRFGRSFQYTRYGFYSLAEVLRSVSDIVQVEQTRAGSLLILKAPVTHTVIPWSRLQPPPPGNLLRGGGSVSVNKELNAPKKPLVPERPPLSAAPKSGGVTTLDRLFMAAKAEYYANKPSAESSGAEKTQRERENPENILPSGPDLSVQSINGRAVSDPASGTKAATTGRPINTDVAEPSINMRAVSDPTAHTEAHTTGRPIKTDVAEPSIYIKVVSDPAPHSEAHTTGSPINTDVAEPSINIKVVSDPAAHYEAHTTGSPIKTDVAEPSINIKVVSDPAAHYEAHTTRSPGDAGPKQTDVAEPSTDRSLQWLQEKFHEGFKLCLSQTRAGFVIGNDLRQDIKRVVCAQPEGLPVSQLLPAYKLHTGKDLPFKEMGFMSVLELVGALGDMLCIEETKEGQEWRLFDIELKNKNDVDVKRTDEKDLSSTDGLITRWNVTSTKKPERLKPPAIVSPSDGQSLWGLPPVVPVSEHQIPPDAVRKQKLCALSRMKRSFMMGVYVENVTSPSSFYIRCYSKDTSQKLENMMIEMRFCYSNEHVSRRYIVPDEYVMVGEVFALSVDGDVWWYRVIVHSIVSPQEVQVFYPDFGTLATVKRCWLRFLKACYMRLPAQAVPAALACLKPVEDRWSAEAIKLFRGQCARRPLVGVVMQYVLDNLCLFLCDTSSDEDVYLHQVLINAGHASLAQEPAIYSTRISFMQYLIPSSELTQETSPDTSEQETSLPEQSPEVLQQEAPVFPTRVSKEAEPELPYLEAFPIGEDTWDEVWSFSGGTAALNEALKPQSPEPCKPQEETPMPGQINDFTKRSDGERVTQPLEEFYISLIESRNVSEKSATVQSPPRKREEKSVPQDADHNDPFPPRTPEKENLQPPDDNCLFCESSSVNQTAAAACNPLTGFQRFQIPRRSAAVALGPAARLAAMPGSLSHWGY